MPTQGIWAPQPRVQLLLALFLPFLTWGGGIALAMAKPLNLSQSSAALSQPHAAAASRFPGCRRRFRWEALPRATPHGEKWEGGSRAVLVPREFLKIQVPGNLLPPGPAEPAGCPLCCYSRCGCLGRSRCGQ